MHEAVAVLPERPDGDDRDDRGERGRLRGQLPEPEPERERRHEHDAAADAEDAGEQSAGEAERERECDVAHQASLAATISMTQANAICRCGPRTRFAIDVPKTTPTTAGRPISAASRQTTRSS